MELVRTSGLLLSLLNNSHCRFSILFTCYTKLMFWRCHRSVVCDLVMDWTALYRHASVCPGAYKVLYIVFGLPWIDHSLYILTLGMLTGHPIYSVERYINPVQRQSFMLLYQCTKSIWNLCLAHWWLREYIYFVLLSSSNRKYELLPTV